MPTAIPNTDCTAVSSHQREESLRQCVLAVLRKFGMAHRSRVRVHINHGCLQISGRVPSYYAKQLAQTAVFSAEEAHVVENELRVAQSPSVDTGLWGAGRPHTPR